MPKRIVDGDALWLSSKVKSLPEKYRIHYAHLLPLAEANGVFEIDFEKIRAKAYAFLCPSITKTEVEKIVRAMMGVDLIRTWDENGKTWGYFTGIEKPGRLPSLKHLDRYTNLPPAPPATLFEIDASLPKNTYEAIARHRDKNQGMRIIYFALAGDKIKIGQCKTSCLANRISQIQTGCPDEIVVLGTMKCDETCSDTTFHRLFGHLRVRGEWFSYTEEIQGYIEKYILNPSLSGIKRD